MPISPRQSMKPGNSARRSRRRPRARGATPSRRRSMDWMKESCASRSRPVVSAAAGRFVNVGAHVGSGTMVDTWATVGSCAQIGKNCHLSGGVGIGGVLEPLQAEPVIIEDDCFIGARSEVVEGVIVEQGAVLAMGTFIS